MKTPVMQTRRQRAGESASPRNGIGTNAGVVTSAAFVTVRLRGESLRSSTVRS